MTWAKGSNIIVDKNQKSPIHVKEKPILNSMTTDSQSELFTNLETDTRDMYVLPLYINIVFKFRLPKIYLSM